jgi:hypothetical protein
MKRKKIILQGVKRAFGVINRFEYPTIIVKRNLSLNSKNTTVFRDKVKTMLNGLNVNLIRMKFTEKTVRVCVCETQEALLDIDLIRQKLHKIV